MDREFYTPREYGERTGLHLRTVRKMIASGRIPTFQPGGPRSRVLIPVSSLTTESCAVDVGRPPVKIEGVRLCPNCQKSVSTSENEKTAPANGKPMLLSRALDELKRTLPATKKLSSSSEPSSRRRKEGSSPFSSRPSQKRSAKSARPS